MKKIISLVYLVFYFLLWVVLPSTGLGAQVYASEFGDRGNYSITKEDANFSDFQPCVNPDWNRISRQSSNENLGSGTGHWPVLFSSILDPKFGQDTNSLLDLIYSSSPFLGSLTAPIIIFPFHYFW
ncbi:hypothetical protein [Algoriphagus winogradskyi]|uniref:Uncharacterized protein n=1 Tax=Algoriphagus winogradskyi TaxID=237017 RepID=A0ABY1PDN4_9BACT|nr:hypothetical protein [Algoriphagus winogradskyi]SMP31560.1 hypothetical protein SAMN06265367_107148 [Algoriphagus winogradskyi]